LIAQFLLAGLALTQLAPAPGTDVPREFVERVRDALIRDYELQDRFTYIERRRDVKVSRLGKVVIGPLRTFEVWPSQQPGQTYKRLIAVDGVPLTPEELAQRDAEHRRDVEKAAERARTEDAGERADRLAKKPGTCGAATRYSPTPWQCSGPPMRATRPSPGARSWSPT
jgi:hypothetical protein